MRKLTTIAILAITSILVLMISINIAKDKPSRYEEACRGNEYHHEDEYPEEVIDCGSETQHYQSNSYTGSYGTRTSKGYGITPTRYHSKYQQRKWSRPTSTSKSNSYVRKSTSTSKPTTSLRKSK